MIHNTQDEYPDLPIPEDAGTAGAPQLQMVGSSAHFKYNKMTSKVYSTQASGAWDLPDSPAEESELDTGHAKKRKSLGRSTPRRIVFKPAGPIYNIIYIYTHWNYRKYSLPELQV